MVRRSAQPRPGLVEPSNARLVALRFPCWLLFNRFERSPHHHHLAVDPLESTEPASGDHQSLRASQSANCVGPKPTVRTVNPVLH
jgi:hypothetical protein